MTNGIKSLVKPYMAISGWTVLLTLVAVSWANNIPLPQWIIGLCLAPGIPYIKDLATKKKK